MNTPNLAKGYRSLNSMVESYSSYTANCPIERDESQGLLEWLYNHMFPFWIQQDLRVRVLQPLSKIEGDVSVLFAQYNYMIYMLLYIVILIIITICFCVIVYYTAIYREQLCNKVKISLGKYIINWIAKNSKALILFNVIGILTNLFAAYNGLSYLVENYIPANLGTFCDLM